MTNFRGIPDPVEGNAGATHKTLHALKEATERDAQGLRTKSLPIADFSRALAGQRIGGASAPASTASLAELRVIVDALQVSVDNNTASSATNTTDIATNAAAIVALDARLVLAEASIIDHEARIVALEP